MTILKYIFNKYASTHNISSTLLTSCFFANGLLTLHLFYTIELMLNKGECEVFLFGYKPGHKAAETTDNMSSSSGPGTAKECTVQCWVKRLPRGVEGLEGEEHRGRQKLTMTS